MGMFPTAHSTIYRNEAGEVIGWSDETGFEPDTEEIERDWERGRCLDCGELHHECKCDQYCDTCGEFTWDSKHEDRCMNPACPSNEGD